MSRLLQLLAGSLLLMSIVGTAFCACDEGYKQRCGLCLKFVNMSMTYPEAKDNCTRDNASMVMPKTNETLTCVREYLWNEHGSYGPWVGLTDEGHDGTFVWDDGGDVQLPNDSELWHKRNGEPRFYYDYPRCAIIYYHAPLGTAPCLKYKARFVCQMEEQILFN